MNSPIGWAIDHWGRYFVRQRDWERWQVDDSNETMIELASLNAFYSTQQPINHTTINREWGGCFVQLARRKLEQNSTIRLRFWFSFQCYKSKLVDCLPSSERRNGFKTTRMQQPLLWCTERLRHLYGSSWSSASYSICECYIGRFNKTTN